MPKPDQPADRPRRDLTPSLVGRLRDGDVRAGDLLNDLYRDAMLRYCRHRLGNPDDAEDAVQNIFCSVLASRQVPESFRAWLYTIARNECNMVLRHRARQKDGDALPSESRVPAPVSGVTTKIGKQEERALVRELLMDLPAIYREPLYLRYAHDLSWKEIACVLGVAESVIKSRLCEGLEKMRGRKAELGRSTDA
jgi:RNA polymerase sigma-70 factor, ECF subfamily